MHFALVCASLSCPRLANRVYAAGMLTAQLEERARAFANDSTRNRYDAVRRVAFLSRIFDWYGPDFIRSKGSVQKYLAAYVDDPVTKQLLSQDGFKVHYIDYDWALNGIYRGNPD